ncbi:MAG: sensor histidine kinase [Actinomycetota bacterium]
MNPARARRLARAAFAGSVVLWIAGILITVQTSPSDLPPLIVVLVPLAIYGGVGMLMASKHPSNPLGWLFCAVGAVVGSTVFSGAYANVGANSRLGTGDAPGSDIAAGFLLLVPAATLAFVLPVFLLLFPDGRLLSRRWRIGVALAATASVLWLIGNLAEAERFSALSSPAFIDRIPAVHGTVAAAGAATVAAAVAGFASLLIRYRRATGDTRSHLRFLTLMLGAMAVATVLSPSLGWISFFLASLVDAFGVLIGIPFATAVAVLTFGLYDVGFVVRKQVVSVVLTIAFVLLFVLLVFSVGSLVAVRGGAGPGSVFLRGLLTGLAILPLRRLAVRLSQRMMFGGRTTPYEVLTSFSGRLGETYATDDVLPRLAALLVEAVGAAEARVWLLLGGVLRLEASWPDRGEIRALAMPDDSLPGELPGTAFEVRDRGETLGAITVVMPANDPMDKRKEALVHDLASQAGLVLRNVRLIEELRESRRRIVTAQDDRAKKLERDLHDGAQQQVVALAVKLRLAEQLWSRDADRAKMMMAELQTDANDALQTLRELAHGIYPPLLADKGIVAALESQARRSPVPVTIEGTIERHRPEVESAVYFCCLEAMQNVAKYAEASTVTIRLDDQDAELRFEVADNGRGFDPASNGSGTGVQGMSDRLAALDGALEVRSGPGEGTLVLGRIPLRTASESSPAANGEPS